MRSAIRRMPREDQYEPGVGYPAGRWEIHLPDAEVPETIQGFPTRETAQEYLDWLRVEFSRTRRAIR